MGILRGHCALFDGAFTLPSKRRFPFPSRGTCQIKSKLAHLSGMEQMVKGLSPQGPKFVVWLSPFLGPIEQGGKSFEELPEYKACKKQIEAIIQFPNFTPPETYGRDLSYLLSNNITFAEALMMQDVPVEGGEEGETEKRSVHGFEIAVLQRISIAKKRVYTMLEASGIFV